MKHCDFISYSLLNKLIKSLVVELKEITIDLEYIEEITDKDEFKDIQYEISNTENRVWMIIHILEELNKDEDI